MLHRISSVWLFALIVGLLAVTSNAMGEQEPQGARRVFSADQSVSMVAPAGWTAKTTDLPRGVKMFLQSPSEGISDRFTENIFVNEDLLPEQHSLNDYVGWNISETRRRNDEFFIVEDSPTQLSGQLARLLIVRHKTQGVIVIEISYYVQRGRIAYSVTGLTLQSEYASWAQRLKTACLTFRLE